MSRIGKKPIEIPKGVTITKNGSNIKVKGPKGELERKVHPNLTVEIKDNELIVTPELIS